MVAYSPFGLPRLPYLNARDRLAYFGAWSALMAPYAMPARSHRRTNQGDDDELNI